MKTKLIPSNLTETSQTRLESAQGSHQGKKQAGAELGQAVNNFELFVGVHYKPNIDKYLDEYLDSHSDKKSYEYLDKHIDEHLD